MIATQTNMIVDQIDMIVCPYNMIVSQTNIIVDQIDMEQANVIVVLP